MWCLREMHLPMQQQLGQEKANFTGKHLCWSLSPAGGFPMKFVKFLRTPINKSQMNKLYYKISH